MTPRFSGRQLSLHSGRIPVFQRRRGRFRFRGRTRAFRQIAAARRGLCRSGKIHPRRRTPADIVLRLRAAFAGGLHRGWVSGLQPALRQDAGGMGNLRRHHQSGRAQQCLSGDRSAIRAVILCVLLHAARRRRDAEFRHRRRRRIARRQRDLSRADRALQGSQPRRHEREGKIHRRLDGRAARRIWFWLEGHDGGAGLFRARLPSRHGRRTGSPRRRALRPDLAFRAAAGGRSRIRDGLPPRGKGDA